MRENKMKLNKLTTVLVSLSMLVMSNMVTATPHIHDSDNNQEQHQRHMKNKKSQKMHKRMIRKLEKAGVSEEQLAEIKLIHESGKALRDSKHQEIKDLKSQVKTLAKNENVDEQALRDLLVVVAEKKADLMLMHINSRSQVKALLNDEQKSQLEAMHQKHSRSE